jgi:Ca-activated chloride channel homolog
MRKAPLVAIAASLALWAATPLRACETALLLAIDVSNSVDAAEYRLQIDGLADAMADPDVAEVMVQGQVALAVLQWSGADRQEMSIGWARMTDQAAVDAFALAVRTTPRAFVQSDTAPAEAILIALEQFIEVADCERHIIDISGDGSANAGGDVRLARSAAQRQGVTINGVAIESLGLAVTGFFERAVITTDGFVVTARGHRDFPRAIRIKLLRELARGIG